MNSTPRNAIARIMIRSGIMIGLLGMMSAMAAPPYGERFRPQYHFSPREGWIGDPDGLVRFRGVYHLFWWGHAVSRDLVYWQELPWPMQGDDGSFMYYTGTVVVDKENTGGWNTPDQPAMVAVYTAHDRKSGVESQRISISTNYNSFHYYEGNPVLNKNSRSFRDPDVFWHEASRQWIMCIARPDDRKVEFYASSDLKTWRYLSAFGPIGARGPLWETPCLFTMPLNGDPSDVRWVLACSMGPNKMQYFVGAFDGKRFALDAEDKVYLERGTGVVGDVWENFEGATIGAWSASGKAFGEGPVHGEYPNGPPVSGYLGRGVGSSSTDGDGGTGVLRSPAFMIERNNINFLIGGGHHPGQACVNLIVDDAVVRTATGRNSEQMVWTGWNVAEYRGREAHFEIVDRREGDWGHIDVDHIVFSDTLYDTGREHARWVDWGSDFYAARMYRDYDGEMKEVVWLGWMGNWDYANQVPTAWGRGVQSIPREIRLEKLDDGYFLRQRPLKALQKLRGPVAEIDQRAVDGVALLKEFQPSRNTYEFEAVLAISDNTRSMGLDLCVGSGQKVALRYDVLRSVVTLDRRDSGDVSFSPAFPVVTSAPVRPSTRIAFHVFVDLCSIEVFVNDGEVVLTSLIFPDPMNRGVCVVSEGGASLEMGRGWMLDSIWRTPP